MSKVHYGMTTKYHTIILSQQQVIGFSIHPRGSQQQQNETQEGHRLERDHEIGIRFIEKKIADTDLYIRNH